MKREKRRRVLGHDLTFGEPCTRMMDGYPKRRMVTTRRVSCSRCGSTWNGVGFVIAKCARRVSGGTETRHD